MGEIAHAVHEGGGRIAGIIPEFLMAREHAVRLGEMIVTPDMHARKRTMFERADAFVALPGGVGTLEELVEQLTWAQLGRHKKPILLANVKGFWDPLCALLDHMERMQFIRAGLSVSYLVEDDVDKHPAGVARGRGRGSGGREADEGAAGPRVSVRRRYARHAAEASLHATAANAT